MWRAFFSFVFFFSLFLLLLLSKRRIRLTNYRGIFGKNKRPSEQATVENSVVRRAFLGRGHYIIVVEWNKSNYNSVIWCVKQRSQVIWLHVLSHQTWIKNGVSPNLFLDKIDTMFLPPKLNLFRFYFIFACERMGWILVGCSNDFFLYRGRHLRRILSIGDWLYPLVGQRLISLFYPMSDHDRTRYSISETQFLRMY